jgi:hypothetical protein
MAQCVLTLRMIGFHLDLMDGSAAAAAKLSKV